MPQQRHRSPRCARCGARRANSTRKGISARRAARRELRRAARPIRPSRNRSGSVAHVMQQLLLDLSAPPAQRWTTSRRAAMPKRGRAPRLACGRGGGALRLSCGGRAAVARPICCARRRRQSQGAGRTLLLCPRARARELWIRTAQLPQVIAMDDVPAADRGRAGNAVPPIPAAARGRRAPARGGRHRRPPA